MRFFYFNARIKGKKPKGKSFDRTDCGELCNIDMENGWIYGSYPFKVMETTKEDAIKKAPEVFDEIWEENGVNVGDLSDTQLSHYDDGDKSSFRMNGYSKHLAYEIDWEVDDEEAIDEALKMDANDFEEMFGFKNNCEDIEDMLRDKFHHCPGLKDDLMGLPSEMEIPDDVYSESIADGDWGSVTDYMSDETGFLINNYNI